MAENYPDKAPGKSSDSCPELLSKLVCGSICCEQYVMHLQEASERWSQQMTWLPSSPGAAAPLQASPPITNSKEAELFPSTHPARTLQSWQVMYDLPATLPQDMGNACLSMAGCTKGLKGMEGAAPVNDSREEDSTWKIQAATSTKQVSR